MAMILLAALAAAASPGPGPDAAQIGSLDFNEGMLLCQRYYHVVPCPADPPVIADVRCEAAADAEGRIRCRYTTRAPRQKATQSCTARFVPAGARWLYAPRPGAKPEVSMPHEYDYEAPVCSATGSPDEKAVLAARAAAQAELSCIVHATSPCPSVSARISELRCNWGAHRLAWCDYRLHDPDEYYCRARFSRAKGRWAMDRDRGTRIANRPREFDESCTGPVGR